MANSSDSSQTMLGCGLWENGRCIQSYDVVDDVLLDVVAKFDSASPEG